LLGRDEDTDLAQCFGDALGGFLRAERLLRQLFEDGGGRFLRRGKMKVLQSQHMRLLAADR